MDNTQANSPLGLASRGLAFALVQEIAGKDWRDRDVDKLQEALYEYGIALAKKTSMLDYTGF
jgi:hypothetical protein